MAGLTPAIAKESRAVRLGRDVHINLLILASRAIDQIEEVCATEGITHSHYAALWTLCLAENTEDGIPLGEIADGLLTRAADVTRLVDRLEQLRLAERVPNPADRRSVLVRVTTEGRQRFERLVPKVQDFHRRQWTFLTTEELSTFDALLVKAMWRGQHKTDGGQ